MKQVLWNPIIKSVKWDQLCELRNNLFAKTELKKKKKKTCHTFINQHWSRSFLSKQTKMSKLRMMKHIYNILLLKKGVNSSVMSTEANSRHYI